MTLFRFHALGIPHTITSKEYSACAFTQKVLNFCKMMHMNGHVVYHYGHEHSIVPCTEHIPLIFQSEFEKCYGTHDWKKNQFKFSVQDSVYQLFYERAVKEIQQRKEATDFLLCFWGMGHKIIADQIDNIIIVEPGIGYPEAFSRWRIYESHAIRNAFQGASSVTSCQEDWYHVVIPNYYDLKDFDFCSNKLDYFLFIGRLNGGKGIQLAIQVCQRLGYKLKIVGQGNLMDLGFDLSKKEYSCLEFVGHVNVQQRKEIMKHAKATIVASMYCEPFGGVQVESLLCGTPIITCDWGCFPEINIHGITGYRCRTFEQFLWAFQNISQISPLHCRQYAESNYSIEKVYSMYIEYFQMVYNVHKGKGWYELKETRHNLNWLSKYIPSKFRALILSEMKWSFGRIYRHLQSFLMQKGICTEMVDWYTPTPTSFHLENYDVIIGPSFILTDVVFQKFFPNQDRKTFQTKCFITIHSPKFQNSQYHETIPVSFEGTITGISQTISDQLESIYKTRIPYTPYSVQSRFFQKLPLPTRIQKLGIVGNLQFGAEFQKIKGFQLFQEIGRLSQLELVYLYYPEKEYEKIYEECDLYICCSQWEGGPLPVFEAIVSGKPVISTKVGNVQLLKNLFFYSTAEEAVSFIEYLNRDPIHIEKYSNLLYDEVVSEWEGDTLFEHYWYPYILRHLHRSQNQSKEN